MSEEGFSEHDAFFDDGDTHNPSDITAEETEAFFSDGAVPDAPADGLLKRMNDLIGKHAQQLADMREAICETVTEAWNEDNRVIAINSTPYDQMNIVGMVRTENAQLNKVTMVFAYLITEVNQMKMIAESRFYGPLAMFAQASQHGESHTNQANGTEANGIAAANGTDVKPAALTLEQQFHALLPILQDCLNFTNRLRALALNLLNQLGCLFHERQKLYLSTFRHVRLESAFEALGVIGRICYTLDVLLTGNEEIVHAWQLYKRMIKYIRTDPAKFGVEKDRLHSFEAMLISVNNNILNGNIFESFLSQEYGLPGGNNNQSLIENNKVLFEQFTVVLKRWIKRIVDSADAESLTGESLMDALCLYVFYRRIFAPTTKPDKKFFNELWLIQKRIPLVPLYADHVFYIADFIGKFAPIDAKSVSQPTGKNITALRAEQLNASDDTFDKRTEEMFIHMGVWMVRMESAIKVSRNHPVHSVLTARARLLINGLLLASQIRTLLTVNLNLHTKLGAPFRAKNIRSYAICCEMLKAISDTYSRRQGMLSEHVSLMIGQTTFILKKILVAYMQRLDKVKKIDDGKLDALAALQLAREMCDQPPTRERLAVLNIAVSIGLGSIHFKDDQNDEIRYQLWKLQLLSTWQRQVDTLCNCNFLYWIANLHSTLFSDIFRSPDQVHRLHHLLAAYADAATLFVGCPVEQRSILRFQFSNEILTSLDSAIITPLCREIETDLRLHIHSVVLQQASLRAQQTTRDLSRFFQLKPLKFFGHFVDLKQRVTHYLDSIFYNLNTVALHDWKVYAEMRNLAHEKYGLVMAEAHLPGTAHYSDSLDVLEIMRNIHIFVARYQYNMNTQIFIQRAADQKHLNTINIHHIADSLRTHGAGVMNTTVNFTYQYLIRKFKVFSEFLFDDHIKSRLIKLARFFKEKREQLQGRFPFETTENFVRDIRKLGVGEDGTTVLDKFRRLITEIGNALAYVRLVRSGGFHHISQSIRFVPDLQDIPDFESDVKAENLGPAAIEAAANLDRVLDQLKKSFSEGSAYFPLLVSIFGPTLRNEQQKHLQNFYIIIPALMLNFVEKMLQLKEKLGKPAGKFETAFTDDGFALGLAYILKVLDLNVAFDSLHWFDAVAAHVAMKRAEHSTLLNNTKKNSSKKNEEEIAQLSVHLKRLGYIQHEFDLLFYSFSGARVFFQDTQQNTITSVEGTKQEEKKPAETAAAPASSDSAPPAPSMDSSVPPAPSIPDAPPGVPFAPPISDDVPMAPPI